MRPYLAVIKLKEKCVFGDYASKSFVQVLVVIAIKII